MDTYLHDCSVCGLPAETVGKAIIITGSKYMEYYIFNCVVGHEFSLPPYLEQSTHDIA